MRGSPEKRGELYEQLVENRTLRWAACDKRRAGHHPLSHSEDGALLAYLAYYLDRTHPREVLFELLWPECLPEAGRERLSTELSSLRHLAEFAQRVDAGLHAVRHLTTGALEMRPN